MVIVDRSFSNLYEVAYHKFHGYLAVLLFRLGTSGWDSNNDVRFYNRGLESQERNLDMSQKGLCPTEEDLYNLERQEAQQEAAGD